LTPFNKQVGQLLGSRPVAIVGDGTQVLNAALLAEQAHQPVGNQSVCGAEEDGDGILDSVLLSKQVG
jgi:hypothetical protein